jgi:hypothetical protein
MNALTLKRLAAALLILVVLWLGLSFIRHARRDTEGRFAITRFDPKAADHAFLIHGADTIRLVRQETGWTVGGFPANQSFVEELLGSLSDTSATAELVAESATSLSRLGLDTTQAHRFVVQAGAKTLSDLLVGSQGGVYGTSYVRKPGDDRSWQLKGPLSEIANRPFDDWRDKTIVRVDPDSVGTIEEQRGRRSVTVTRADKGAWKIGATDADSAAVAGLLNQLRVLQASSFAGAAQADSAHFERPDRLVRLTSRAGAPLAVLRMDSTAGGFWVRKDGDSTVYRLDAWLANQVVPMDSTLRKKK